MKALLMFGVISLFLFGCDIQGRLTIKNRTNERVGILMDEEFKGVMPYNYTPSVLLLAPKSSIHQSYDFDWQWTKDDEASFHQYIKRNIVNLNDSVMLSYPKIITRRQGLIGKGMVVRLR